MPLWPKAKYVLSASFLSLVVGLLAFYYELHGTRTSLVVDMMSESNVMDVRTPVADLSILFQGQDIQKENSNLRILGVRLVNEGNTNILESYFDSRIPWGLEIDGGRLIEARVTGSNSQYLSANLHPKVSNGHEVTFDKVIFDKGKYVALELLVLHDKSLEPQVKPIGKIAGMDDIPIRNSFRERDQEGFKSKVFKGPIAVQIARTIAYFFIGVGTIVIFGLLIAGIGSIPSRLKKRARRKWVRYLPKEDSVEKEKKRQALVSVFVEGGLPGLKRVQRILASEESVAKALGYRRVRIEDAHRLPSAAVMQMERADAIPNGEYIYFHAGSPLDPLIEAGLVRRVGENVEIDSDARELLSSLIRQLSEFEDDKNESTSTERDTRNPHKT